MRDLQDIRELINPEGITDGKIVAAQARFYDYCKMMNPKFYRDDRPYQRDLCETLQAIFEGRLINKSTGEPYKNLMINLPPRHGKSYTLTLFVQWCMGKKNDTRVISVSYNDILAGRFARNVRDGIDADKIDSKVTIFHDVFPTTRVKQGDAAAQLWSLEGQFFNYLATGFGGTITGIGCSMGIIDDPIKNDQEAFNDRVLDEQYDATGTLIFFDNSEAVGPQLSVEEVTGQKKKNFIQNTLDKARERLFHRENQQQRQDRFRRTFIDPRSQETVRPNLPRGPRFMALDYDGEKALVNIPPDTVIEVPFLNHIPYFFSRIEVYADGSIGVTETIQRVVEPGDDSFYGINRYFSKYHMDRAGHTHRSLPTVLEAFVDGRPVEAEIMPSSFGVRISVRDDFPLPPGVHVYNITYLFPDKIAEFKEQEDADGFKELIWSVTGQHWNMPITRAGTSIIFPRGAQVVSQSAATGSLHNPAQQYKVRKDPEGNLSFTLTYPLAEGRARRSPPSSPCPTGLPAWLFAPLRRRGLKPRDPARDSPGLRPQGKRACLSSP